MLVSFGSATSMQRKLSKETHNIQLALIGLFLVIYKSLSTIGWKQTRLLPFVIVVLNKERRTIVLNILVNLQGRGCITISNIISNLLLTPRNPSHSLQHKICLETVAIFQVLYWLILAE
jgi:fucose permease